MSASVFKIQATGNSAIATTMTVPVGQTYIVHCALINFSAAPTTSENLTITVDDNAGSAYDTIVHSVDPSSGSVTDIEWYPGGSLLLVGGDALDVAYTNTDTVTYGVSILAERVA